MDLPIASHSMVIFHSVFSLYQTVPSVRKHHSDMDDTVVQIKRSIEPIINPMMIDDTPE